MENKETPFKFLEFGEYAKLTKEEKELRADALKKYLAELKKNTKTT